MPIGWMLMSSRSLLLSPWPQCHPITPSAYVLCEKKKKKYFLLFINWFIMKPIKISVTSVLLYFLMLQCLFHATFDSIRNSMPSVLSPQYLSASIFSMFYLHDVVQR